MVHGAILPSPLVIGDWCVGSHGQISPFGRSPELHDTTVDKLVGPYIFVVYHDAQVYTVYLVSIKERTSGTTAAKRIRG